MSAFEEKTKRSPNQPVEDKFKNVLKVQEKSY